MGETDAANYKRADFPQGEKHGIIAMLRKYFKAGANMSEYYIRALPEDIDTKISSEHLAALKKIDWNGSVLEIKQTEEVQFADAGENFETVSCPFCGSDLMAWWGGAMNSAYEDGKGFFNLSITTPCCNKLSSLHELKYYFPQGFFRTMIEISPSNNHSFTDELLRSILFQHTGVQWRILHSHY